jgi:hypothetical protein
VQAVVAARRLSGVRKQSLQRTKRWLDDAPCPIVACHPVFNDCACAILAPHVWVVFFMGVARGCAGMG